MSDRPSNGTDFIHVLTIIFVVLKLIGVIHWSWWWVLSPLWIVFILIIVIYTGAFLIDMNRR